MSPEPALEKEMSDHDSPGQSFGTALPVNGLHLCPWRPDALLSLLLGSSGPDSRFLRCTSWSHQRCELVDEWFSRKLLNVSKQTRELYAARVTLEREFASKLQALVRKASEKKAKALSVYVFGNEPTKSWDSNTLKQRSELDFFYSVNEKLNIHT